MEMYTAFFLPQVSVLCGINKSDLLSGSWKSNANSVRQKGKGVRAGKQEGSVGRREHIGRGRGRGRGRVLV